MVSSSRHSRTSSPPPSIAHSTSSALSTHQQKFNIVTRLSIEGKAKRGSDGRTDGASIRIYLKMAIPQDSVTPGATIPLFPEDNLKIFNSQVHPLDSTSTPYHFSSSTCPLLHRASTALSLPVRLKLPYNSIFGSTSASHSASNAPPVDEAYTGVIIVSGYHVSFVLPKEFPPRNSPYESRTSSRRSSTPPVMQFMAAIEAWVPFLTKPPSSPYLLSIPTPRCLSNNIKLSIFSPVTYTTSASLASLSSGDEESTRWELTSEPHVTRIATNRLSRTGSTTYSSLADDESSDSSTVGFAEGYGLRGTFQSTDRIRVRWAKPIKGKDAPEAADGRRRVGLREAQGNMTCIVLGNNTFGRKGKHRSVDAYELGQDGSIAMKLEYSATCKGVWFPGVATLLGLDVGLDAGDCEVEWAPNGDQGWTITGGPGYNGFAVGPPEMPSLSRRSSQELPSRPSTPASRSRIPIANGITNGVNGSTSVSLLRAPLPSQSVEEYSFEASPSTTPTSSIGSLATIPSDAERSRTSSLNGFQSTPGTDTDDSEVPRPPKNPITIHVNMNELLPPAKNVFTFQISGIVIVRPRKSGYFSPRHSPTLHRPGSPDSDPLTLPQFRVLFSDRESGTVLLRNELSDATLDVYNPAGRITDPQSRKTVLQSGGHTKCGHDGARIIVRPSIPPAPPIRQYSSSSSASTRSSRAGAPQVEDSMEEIVARKLNGVAVTPAASTSKLRETMMLGASISRPKRDGPLMVHSAVVTVTPRPNTGRPAKRRKGGGGGGDGEWKVPREYAVRVCLPVPADAESDWLEFGLALPAGGGCKEKGKEGCKVHVASASVESVPVKFETFAAMKPSSDLKNLDLPFERVSGKEWNTWVKVHVGESGGGTVEVVYLVDVIEKEKEQEQESGKRERWKGKEKDEGDPVMDVLLPIFSLPVGRLEVHIEAQTGCEIASLDSNLIHQQISASGSRLLHYSMDEFFEPKLAIIFNPPLVSSSPYPFWKIFQILKYSIAGVVVLYLLNQNVVLNAKLSQTQQSTPSALPAHTSEPPVVVVVTSAQAPKETVTVTHTSVTTSTLIAGDTPDSSSSSEIFTRETLHEPQSSPTPPLDPASSDPSATSIVSDPPSLSSPTPSTMSTISPTTVSAYSAYPSGENPESTFHQYALDILRKVPLSWYVDIPVREVVGKAVERLGLVWQICKRIYHYPVNPP